MRLSGVGFVSVCLANVAGVTSPGGSNGETIAAPPSAHGPWVNSPEESTSSDDPSEDPSDAKISGDGFLHAFAGACRNIVGLAPTPEKSSKANRSPTVAESPMDALKKILDWGGDKIPGLKNLIQRTDPSLRDERSARELLRLKVLRAAEQMNSGDSLDSALTTLERAVADYKTQFMQGSSGRTP